jgi:transcriptional regulator with XRE-family HTH domain
MLTADQRRLLGEFIRAHRERARPVEASGRRRTPGLRREELAAKAGISATWCAWIEQGRPVQASSEALDRLARALSLSRAERDYLFELAGRSDPDIRPDPDIPASLLAAVTAVRYPAYGLDTPVAGTKRRPGFFAFGWTATTSEISCGLCFLNRPRAN